MWQCQVGQTSSYVSSDVTAVWNSEFLAVGLVASLVSWIGRPFTWWRVCFGIKGSAGSLKSVQKRCVSEPPVYTPQQGAKKSPSNPFPGSKKGVFGVGFLQRNPYGTLRRVRGVGKKRPKKVCKRNPPFTHLKKAQKWPPQTPFRAPKKDHGTDGLLPTPLRWTNIPMELLVLKGVENVPLVRKQKLKSHVRRNAIPEGKKKRDQRSVASKSIFNWHRT